MFILTKRDKYVRDNRASVLNSNSNATKNLILTRKKLEEDVSSLCELYDKAHVNLLEIRSINFTKETASSLVLILSKLGSIKIFKVRNSKIMKNHMKVIMDALVPELKLNSLTFHTTLIQKKGIKIVCQLLERLNLECLSLVEAGIDNAQLSILATGISNANLSFLNLSHNIFEGKGFVALMQGLQKKLTVTQLMLSDIQMDTAQALHCKNFLIKGQDNIKALSLVECDFPDDAMGEIITSIARCSEMNDLTLSKSRMSDENCERLVNSLHYNTNFTTLGLSRVKVSDHGIICLMLGFTKSNLKYLNISRNHLTPAIIEQLCYFVQKTTSLEKLLLQHNNFDEKCMLKLGVTLLEHNKTLQYLDVSCNNFSDEGLLALLRPLAKKKDKLHTLGCRKNNITGDNCAEELKDLLTKMLLRVIDFAHNDLRETTAESFLQMARHQALLEFVNLTGNRRIPFQLLDEITEECISNLLIQERVIPQIERQKNKDDFKKDVEISEEVLFWNILFEGTEKSLTIENQQFESVDFLFKFVHLAQHKLHSLELRNLTQTPNTSKKWLSKDIFQCNQVEGIRLKTLEFENLDIDQEKLTQLLKDIKYLKNIENLGLNKIKNMKHVINILEEVAIEHPKLNKLELRDNQLLNLHFVTRMLEKCKTLSILDIRGNSIHNEDIRKITKALEQNVDMRNIMHDHEKCEKTEEGQALRESMIHELKLNFFIDVFITPKARELPYIPSGKKMQLRVDLTDEPNLNLEALCKFLALRDVLELSLKRTKLNAKSLKQMVDSSWAKMPLKKRIMYKLDLSENPDLDCDSCHVVKTILEQLPFLVSLDLSSTSISNDGLQIILNSLKLSLSLRNLQMNDCQIEMRNQNDCEDIAKSLSRNCSLTILGLKGNSVDPNAVAKLQEQLDLNRHIKALIIPQIHEQARNASGIKPVLSIEDLRKERNTALQKSLNLSPVHMQKKMTLFAFAKQSLTPTKSDQDSVKGRKGAISFNSVEEPKFEEIGAEELPLERQQSFNEVPIKEHVQTLFIKLRYVNYEFINLDFLTKFLKTFPNVSEIDFSNSKVQPDHILELAELLKTNKFITGIQYDNSKVDLKTRDLIATEMKKNLKTIEYFSKELLSLSFTMNFDKVNSLEDFNLSYKKISDLSFVTKLCWGYNHLKVVNLSHNNLGPASMGYVKELLFQQKSLVELNLANNNLVSEGLHLLCSALVGTKMNPIKLESLNIENNGIPDEDLKMLLALFQRNLYLLRIKYSLVKPDNIAKYKSFQSIQEAPSQQIKKTLLVAHHVHYKLWEKVVFPVYLWKSLIHAKHEAFRFKYVTKGLVELENGVMKTVNVIMYINALVYYVLVLYFPLTHIDDCGEGVKNISHYAYTAYAIANIIFEGSVVLYVTKKLNSYQDKVIELNRWHLVEIMFGQIARFDTYLDVCFLSIMIKCEKYPGFLISISVFVCLSLIYPIFILITKMRTPKSLKHTMPNIERLCHICFIRENMLLATLLDSVCINNMQNFCKRRVVFGKLQATLGLFLQDFPQLIIHLVFLFAVHDDELHSNITVKLSLAVSFLAICVSFFNFMMFKPNEFDPILLEYELKKRQELKQQNVLAPRVSVMNSKRRYGLPGVLKRLSGKASDMIGGTIKPEPGLIRKTVDAVIKIQEESDGAGSSSESREINRRESIEEIRQDSNENHGYGNTEEHILGGQDEQQAQMESTKMNYLLPPLPSHVSISSFSLDEEIMRTEIGVNITMDTLLRK